MSIFICPVCRAPLKKIENSLICENSHCYDFAKSGYVNLLRSNRKSHGDCREMIDARRAFLNKGYYSKLACAIAKAALEVTPENGYLLDAGCGEGYYTGKISELFGENRKAVRLAAIDVSKDAANLTAKTYKNVETAVASAYSIPIDNNKIDTVCCIFSPAATEEFIRILKPGGTLIMVIGAKNHLWSLKKAVYSSPYKNQTAEYQIDGLSFVKRIPIDYELDLTSKEDIANLFLMTPYSHKTSYTDMQKLNRLDFLKTEASFEILIYKKP